MDDKAAKEIPLFTTEGGDYTDASPRTMIIAADTSYNDESAAEGGRGLQAFTAMDEADDKCSS